MTSNQVPAYVDVAAIQAEYAPYNRFAEFAIGYAEGLSGKWTSKFENVAAQAYDRGLEAGTRVLRQARWIAENVGAD